jgi:hypothetical protein
MPSPDVSAKADPVILAVDYPVHDELIELRVSKDYGAELQQMLSAEGVDQTPLFYATGGIPGFAMYLASIAGGLGGLAAVLNAFFRRHQHKAVLMERDGTRYELKGMSPDEMRRIIARMLEEASLEEAHPDLHAGLPGTEDENER